MYSDEIKKDCRIIHTGLFGERNLSIIESIEGQLSDGMWENSARMESYWMFETTELLNDEVVIYVSNKWGEYKWNRCKNNAFVSLHDNEIKIWFGNKIKQIVKQEIKDWHNENLSWKRDCQTELCYFHDNLTVAECYAAYDKLLGRVR